MKKFLKHIFVIALFSTTFFLSGYLCMTRFNRYVDYTFHPLSKPFFDLFNHNAIVMIGLYTLVAYIITSFTYEKLFLKQRPSIVQTSYHIIAICTFIYFVIVRKFIVQDLQFFFEDYLLNHFIALCSTLYVIRLIYTQFRKYNVKT